GSAGWNGAGPRSGTPAAATIRAVLAAWPRPGGAATGSPISLGDLPQRINLQLLVGDDPLQPGVLGLQLLQPLDVVSLHATELSPPPVIGRLGDLQVPSHIRDLTAFSQQPVGFAELADDLLGGVPAPCHRDDPPFAQHHGLRALITGGPVSGDQVTSSSSRTPRSACSGTSTTCDAAAGPVRAQPHPAVHSHGVDA